jgi:hypothetical protein
MAFISFPEWLPDLSAHQNPGLVTCSGVYPRTKESYGPVNSLSVFSNAMTARNQGAFMARDQDQAVHVFAGDIADLYRITSTLGATWENVSRGAGTPDYTTPGDGQWKFAQYGSRVLATNFTDDIQSYVLGTSTDFAQLAAAAPRARHVAVVRDFVVVANTWDAVDGNKTERIWWSAIDDPTNWPAIGSSAAAAVQSDRQDLVGEGGPIMALVGSVGVGDGVVIQERAIQRMTYVGPPAVFQFDTVQGARGTVAQNSVAQLGAVVAYLGENGFYLFDGRTSVPIGANKIDSTFFADLDTSYYSRVIAAVDPINKLFYWIYPGAGSGGIPNRLLIWNWTLERWSRCDISMNWILRSASFGYNLDNADGLGYNVDTSPFGPDDRFWAGGVANISAIDTLHRLAFFSGTALAAELETGDLDLAEGRRVFVRGVRPVVDGGTITASVGTRDLQSATRTYTTATAPGSNAFCPQRVSARFASARVNIAAAGSWSHARGIEPDIGPAGRR